MGGKKGEGKERGMMGLGREEGGGEMQQHGLTLVERGCVECMWWCRGVPSHPWHLNAAGLVCIMHGQHVHKTKTSNHVYPTQLKHTARAYMPSSLLLRLLLSLFKAFFYSPAA